MRVIWKPQPKQALMMSRREYEALYGGAAGGGKSDYLLCEALRQVHIPHYKGLILRKTTPQLTELIDRSRVLYGQAFPKARYNGSSKCWTFPSGAKIYFGHMHTSADRFNYQGLRYDFIGFDELTHFTYEEYSYMYSRNRPGGEGTRIYVRATANPGGIGHGWVKSHFITPAEPMSTVKTPVQIVDESGKLVTRYRDKIFVPSSVFDNKILLKNDPDYVSNLSLLPESERKALLYGDWDSFSGQVFIEWRNDAEHYDDQRFTHVISPFKIPKDWTIYRGFDFGYTKPYAVGWYACDHEGTLYRIAELYGCTGQPNVGLKDTPQDIARKIKAVEESDPNIKGRFVKGIADPSIFDESRGESIARAMQREGIYFFPGDNTRIAGKMQYHYRFAFDDNGRAKLYIFNTCKEFIRTIPTLVYDDRKVEDINTDLEDHIYDECRYVLMEHPINKRQNKQFNPVTEDPLNLKGQDNDKYRFYRV